jgi:hypothetical protein
MSWRKQKQTRSANRPQLLRLLCFARAAKRA